MKLTSPLVAALLGACCLPVQAENPATPAKPQPAPAAAKSTGAPSKPVAAQPKAAAPKVAAPARENKVPPQVTAAAPKSAPVMRRIGRLDWYTDYAAAYEAARSSKKMLLMVFRDDRQARNANYFEQSMLAQPELVNPLSNVVRVVLPLNVAQPVAAAPVAKMPAPVADKGSSKTVVAAKPIPAPAPAKPGRLIDHSSFEFMYGQPGIAMIDLTNKKSVHYGQLVSAHPFGEGNVLSVDNLRTILNLPKATVTQRALIYSVLVNAAPISTTQGQCHDSLCEAARRGSELMAQYGSVGHHEWGERSNQVMAATGRGASEVAASGGGTLQQAADQCVNAWQGSPAHWGIMTTPATLYGYDLVRCPNGGWYGTGVFAN